ncbi:MAG: hypothetical protein COT84_06085 [Chlamydiae bacterium CG10_big_fil_rev_8_21_14_0_10_35_9]|nr:MAG: hypothetical protein COT84_06085 [Chlamydiae bacterium CG10_big_fil_rev_8_21_14_0_10_35_9]
MNPHIDLAFFYQIYEKNRAMMGFAELLNLYHLLSRVLLEKTEGEVVELGCYKGFTAILMQKLLDSVASDKRLFVYDSFEGLPEKSDKDLWDNAENIRKCDFLDNKRVGKGWFKASRETLLENCKKLKVKEPIICQGFFDETLPLNLPNKISFAHLDADFYSSTLTALEHVYPRLVDNGILLIDDYCDPKIFSKKNTLPGVKRACDEFFKNTSQKIINLPGLPNQSQAYLVKEAKG